MKVLCMHSGKTLNNVLIDLRSISGSNWNCYLNVLWHDNQIPLHVHNDIFILLKISCTFFYSKLDTDSGYWGFLVQPKLWKIYIEFPDNAEPKLRVMTLKSSPDLNFRYTKLPGNTNFRRSQCFAYDLRILELISLSNHWTKCKWGLIFPCLNNFCKISFWLLLPALTGAFNIGVRNYELLWNRNAR